MYFNELKELDLNSNYISDIEVFKKARKKKRRIFWVNKRRKRKIKNYRKIKMAGGWRKIRFIR